MIKVIYGPVRYTAKQMKRDRNLFDLAIVLNENLKGQAGRIQSKIEYSGINSWSTEEDVVVLKIIKSTHKICYDIKRVKTPRLKAKILRAIGGEIFRGKPTQKPQK